MDELKPCPFCGGEAEVQKAKSTSYFGRKLPYKVKCKRCHCALAYQFFGTEKDATKAWNRRADNG